MERFLTAFNRSQQHKRDEEGRSYQFAKKRLSANYSPFDIPTTEKDPGPILHVSDLSSVEKETFVTWWNGLDPFGLGVVQTDVLLSFLIGSKLSQDHLKQILSLYEGELRYTDKQFFAILRLISHAQSGRHVQRDLIAMGGKSFFFFLRFYA
ncbi:hypothetical protein DM01DRAFT_1389058 [Hesseltinella vesiculosa]|uniref:EH domain-containing protein n=1 Tax=Hesseltinella vesiculosa TaxID=101127 RepID=A0A1X2GJP3_9FUNG|nr:hypothetical protein DM01DRAFT_1389058 [Hesseltinella vesiculosa]